MDKGPELVMPFGFRVDREFDKTMLITMKKIVAEAFLELEGNIRIKYRETRKMGELEISLINQKANQMKEEISNFIDSQVQRIIAESSGHLQFECQETELPEEMRIPKLQKQ